MVPCEYGLGQIVESFSAVFTRVFLPSRLGFVMTSFDDIVRMAVRARCPVRPPQVPHGFVALFVTDQMLNANNWLEHYLRSPLSAQE